MHIKCENRQNSRFSSSLDILFLLAIVSQETRKIILDLK